MDSFRTTPGKKPNARCWLFAFMILGFIWVVSTQFNQVEALVKTLTQGRLEWVLAAPLIQLIYFIFFSATFQFAFSTLAVRSRLIDLIPITLGSRFLNVVAPSAGMSGATLFVEDAARRGNSPALAAAGTLLQLVSDFIAFSFILLVGLAYLFIQQNLTAYEVVAAILLLLLTLFLSALLMLGLWHPDLLRSLFAWIQKVENNLAARFQRTLLLTGDMVERYAADFSRAAAAISKNPRGLARTIGMALAAHGLERICLYILFLAFYGPVHFGPLVAGYAMGILFSLITITPQGVGVVEGVMAIVFGSLGIPKGVAVAVSLSFRGLTFWLPLLLGFISLRRVNSHKSEERSHAAESGGGTCSVHMIALFTAMMGVLNVLIAVTPASADRLAVLDKLLPLTVQRGGNLTAALSGFTLLILAGGLRRHKRTAWLLTLVVLVISCLSYLIEGLNFEASFIAAGLAVWLIASRDQFQARSDPPSVRQGLHALIAGLLFTVVYGVTGFYLLDRHYSVNFNFWDAIRQTIVMFTQFYDPGLQPITGFGQYFATSIYVVGAATLLFALFMLIRPVIIRQPATRNERSRARDIVEAYGRSSMARLTLLEDKTYFFSSGSSVIAYTVNERVAVTLGDPVGPVEDVRSSIDEFKEFCAKNDWRPAFYQVLPDYLDLYQEAGFDVLCIGHEAIVDLQNFTLEGKAAKDMRYSYNRSSRLGYQAKLYEPPLPDSLLAELHSVSDEWLTMMHGSEKRFSLGWFEEDYIRNSLVMAVHTPDGHISAFANVNSEYQKNEATVDLMRRRRAAESGTMDFLFVSLFLWAKSKGYDTFNLGLSSLSGVGENPDDPVLEQAMHYIYEHINQFYNFKGLHEFKEKFGPIWSPRYLIYPGPDSLLPTVFTVIAANSGGNPIMRNIIQLRFR